MPQVCTVCAHPRRMDIEKAHVEGQAARAIARRLGISRNALFRHVRANHVLARIAKVVERKQVAEGSELLERLLDLNRQTMEILSKARRGGKSDLALKAISRAEAQLELQARLVGELKDRQVNIVNLMIDPETAERMATLYLRRRAAPAEIGPIVDTETMAETVSNQLETQEIEDA